MHAESIGERLRKAREQKNLSHEYVARETNIAKRYLQALEDEDFSAFPGEPYLLGFLRNYAEYLGLKPEELVAAYRSLKIQEQPIPVQQLLDRGPRVNRKSLGLIISVAVLAIGGIVLAAVLSNRSAQARGAKNQHQASISYDLKQSPFEKRLYKGDSLSFRYRDETYKLSVADIGDAVSIETPRGQQRFSLGEEFGIDVDFDNVPELRGTILDFKKGAPEFGAQIRLEFGLADQNPALASPEALASGQTSPSTPNPSSSLTPSPRPSTGPAQSPSLGAGGRSQTLIESRNTPYPFTMTVNFRQYCMFRHEIDKKDRSERYYRKGDLISVNANNGIKIWLTNASACSVQVVAGGKTINVDLGNPGEVVVKNIKWVQSDNGSWVLSAVPVD